MHTELSREIEAFRALRRLSTGRRGSVMALARTGVILRLGDGVGVLNGMADAIVGRPLAWHTPQARREFERCLEAARRGNRARMRLVAANGDCLDAWLVPSRSTKEHEPPMVLARQIVLMHLERMPCTTSSIDELRVLYGLTLAEASLARALVLCGRLRLAAAQVGVSYQTARSYLKIIFQKTLTNSQRQLRRRLERGAIDSPT